MPTICVFSWPLPDRLPAVGHDTVVAVGARLEPFFDRGQDRQWILAARVVGGGDREVGEVSRDLAHQRTLALILLPSAAEDHHDFGARELPQRADRRLEGGIGVGEVDDRQKRLTGAHRLHAPGERTGGFDAARHRFE